MSHENLLGLEKSPYLLQHKNNPVNWFPWGDAAVARAKSEDKPIFLSIGYSTCHWCHVMEKESFESLDVADILNKNFIAIKVDREERPDIDGLYMDAVVAMTGQGGWPMSVFLNHKLQPFYGGTYFPKNNFIQLLTQLNEFWKNDRKRLDDIGEDLIKHLSQEIKLSEKIDPISLNEFKLAYSYCKSSYDAQSGGFGGAPKFPPSTRLQLLLRIHRRTGDAFALKMVDDTLRSMAQGGMYDHIGGGFARYSTDAEWLVPHFEKMLYDNAVLILTYLEGFQVTKNPMYKNVAIETADYILRDMQAPNGGFYSAEDADSEGEEGKFYLWGEDELRKILSSDELTQFHELYFTQHRGMGIIARHRNKPWEKKALHEKLFSIREKRIHPHKDDKILTSWNGHMIAALSHAHQVTNDEKYLHAAQKAATFIKSHLVKDGKLLRRYRDGDAKFDAYLDDYAFFIYGLMALYESDFNDNWITWAKELQLQQDQLFWDNKNGGYFYSRENDPNLLFRSKDFEDHAEPNGNGISALNLLKLNSLTFDKKYLEKAETIFKVASQNVKKYPPAYASLLNAYDYYNEGAKEIAIIGKQKVIDLLFALRTEFIPNKVVANDSDLPLTAGKTKIENQTTVYVCEKGTCLLPSHINDKLKRKLLEIKSYEL